MGKKVTLGHKIIYCSRIVTRVFVESCKKIYETQKKEFYQRRFENFKIDIKKTWKQINALLSNRDRSTELPAYFTDSDRTITEKDDIADSFNKFFCNIGPQ